MQSFTWLALYLAFVLKRPGKDKSGATPEKKKSGARTPLYFMEVITLWRLAQVSPIVSKECTSRVQGRGIGGISLGLIIRSFGCFVTHRTQ